MLNMDSVSYTHLVGGLLLSAALTSMLTGITEPLEFTFLFVAPLLYLSLIHIFTDNDLYGDVFGEDDGDLKNTDYWKVLNVEDNGVMGYLSIPKINIKLAIYHGTGNDVLQTGVGHLNGTKLPIGGESNHACLLYTSNKRRLL